LPFSPAAPVFSRIKKINNHHDHGKMFQDSSKNDDGCKQGTQQQSLRPTTACGLPMHGPTHLRSAKAFGFAPDSALPGVAHLDRVGEPDIIWQKYVGEFPLKNAS